METPTLSPSQMADLGAKSAVFEHQYTREFDAQIGRYNELVGRLADKIRPMLKDDVSDERAVPHEAPVNEYHATIQRLMLSNDFFEQTIERIAI
jgi:hypothetical protein